MDSEGNNSRTHRATGMDVMGMEIASWEFYMYLNAVRRITLFPKRENVYKMGLHVYKLFVLCNHTIH